MLTIQIKTSSLVLHHEKCAYWPEENALIVSDLHAGKVTHFRKAGIPVPAASYAKDLARLRRLLTEFTPERCIFLGDLFHSKMNSEWEQLDNLFHEFSATSFILVRGNHDRSISEKSSSRMDVADTLKIGDFLLSHEPARTDLFNFFGHIHPSVFLTHKGRQSMSLPCFALTSTSMVFPAFGSFTGRSFVRNADFERIYGIGGNMVFEVNTD